MKKFFILAMASMLSGCIPLTIAGSAVVGTTIAEERTAGTKVDDNILEMKIKEAFLQRETSEIFSRISVNVMEGRVLLTGSVSNAQFIDEAVEIVWKKGGVRELMNEIEISSKGPQDHAKDIYIGSAVRSKLLFEKDLNSVNYVVDVNNGVVFLLGIAKDSNELNRAVKIAGEVKGVKKVVSHVILKNDPRRLKNSSKQ